MWGWLLLVILLGMVYFGLRPQAYDFMNHVGWIEGKTGIHFSQYGLAYTQLPGRESRSDAKGDERFSLEVAFTADEHQKEGFRFLLSLHSGSDKDQVLVGQWGPYIIVMKGDDFEHTRRDPRISVKLGSQMDAPTLLAITTDANGTSIYVDGRRVERNPKLKLYIPPGPAAWLTLGNSVYGEHSWSGQLLGLAIYDKTLSPEQAGMHFQDWKANGSLASAKIDDPLHLYLFDEGQGEMIQDHGRGRQALHVPPRMPILKKQILGLSWTRLRPDKNVVSDFLINLLGFVPLGAVLMVVLGRTGGLHDRHAMIAVVALCFFFSLSIEVTQAWMPSRSSNLHDLVLNTLGGGGGAFASVRMRIFNF